MFVSFLTFFWFPTEEIISASLRDILNTKVFIYAALKSLIMEFQNSNQDRVFGAVDDGP